MAEWQAYDRVEPLDPWPLQMLAATIANIWCKKRFSPEDFLPAPPKGTNLKARAMAVFGRLGMRQE